VSAERIAALEAVAEAARNAAAGRTGWGFVRDALPAEPQTVGETVEVRAIVWRNGRHLKVRDDKELMRDHWRPIARIAAIVPDTDIPTIRATVAPGGGE
jgi:hypothetical protein